MLWGSSLKFAQSIYHSLVKWCNWPIVVGNDSMDLQKDKSNIDNEEKASNALKKFLQIFTFYQP
jgi:hypothetical protein